MRDCAPAAPAIDRTIALTSARRLALTSDDTVWYVEAKVDRSLHLSTYALAARDGLGLGTPERVTLYHAESATRLSTTRTDSQLDAVREDQAARVARIRSGDFAATPPKPCWTGDYAAICSAGIR